MNVSLPATISKVMTMRDNTVRIWADCQEVNPEYMAEMFALNNKLGWFFFADQMIKEVPKDLPDIKFETWEKHPSQQMRAILFRLWEQTDRSKSSEVFYREKMNELNEMLKSKLN